MQLCMKIMLRWDSLPILTPNTIYRSELTIFRFEITFVSPLSPASPNGIVQFNTTIKYESLMTGDGISFACGLENSSSIMWALKPVRVFIPGTRMFEALVALLSLYLFLLQFPGKLSVAMACYFSNTSHFISAHAGASCLPHLVRLFVIFFFLLAHYWRSLTSVIDMFDIHVILPALPILTRQLWEALAEASPTDAFGALYLWGHGDLVRKTWSCSAFCGMLRQCRRHIVDTAHRIGLRPHGRRHRPVTHAAFRNFRLKSYRRFSKALDLWSFLELRWPKDAGPNGVRHSLHIHGVGTMWLAIAQARIQRRFCGVGRSSAAAAARALLLPFPSNRAWSPPVLAGGPQRAGPRRAGDGDGDGDGDGETVTERRWIGETVNRWDGDDDDDSETETVKRWNGEAVVVTVTVTVTGERQCLRIRPIASAGLWDPSEAGGGREKTTGGNWRDGWAQTAAARYPDRRGAIPTGLTDRGRPCMTPDPHWSDRSIRKARHRLTDRATCSAARDSSELTARWTHNYPWWCQLEPANSDS